MIHSSLSTLIGIKIAKLLQSASLLAYLGASFNNIKITKESDHTRTQSLHTRKPSVLCFCKILLERDLKIAKPNEFVRIKTCTFDRSSVHFSYFIQSNVWFPSIRQGISQKRRFISTPGTARNTFITSTEYRKRQTFLFDFSYVLQTHQC